MLSPPPTPLLCPRPGVTTVSDSPLATSCCFLFLKHGFNIFICSHQSPSPSKSLPSAMRAPPSRGARRNQVPESLYPNLDEYFLLGTFIFSPPPLSPPLPYRPCDHFPFFLFSLFLCSLSPLSPLLALFFPFFHLDLPLLFSHSSLSLTLSSRCPSVLSPPPCASSPCFPSLSPPHHALGHSFLLPHHFLQQKQEKESVCVCVCVCLYVCVCK